MADRGLSREGCGRKLINLGKNMEVVSRARIEVEAMRLMVLRAAKAMDTLGNAEARVWVSAAKAMVPERCCDIIDDAIQMHGAAGIAQWFPLADMWHGQRTLRLADGPDEVHHQVVARAEVKNRASERPPELPTLHEAIFTGPYVIVNSTLLSTCPGDADRASPTTRPPEGGRHERHVAPWTTHGWMLPPYSPSRGRSRSSPGARGASAR